MIKKILFSGIVLAFSFQASLASHCQMPCGIYHDDMVFDQIDQYVETMAKGVSMLAENKLATVQDHNTFIRWVILKETESDKTSELITTFFLQQKIKPGEEDTEKRVLSAHRLLFYIVAIKQQSNLKYLNDFYEEWERFKLMFHIEGYECKMEQVKLKRWAEKAKQNQAKKEESADSNANQSKDRKEDSASSTTDQSHSHDNDDHDHNHDDHDHDHIH